MREASAGAPALWHHPEFRRGAREMTGIALGISAWGVVAGVAMALLVAGLASYGSARVEVSGAGLRAGRAHIEASFLGSAEALDAERTRRVAGPEADARAFLLLRPYLKRAVRVDITDPADPTPYWLVSSRRPDELAAALNGLGR